MGPNVVRTEKCCFRQAPIDSPFDTVEDLPISTLTRLFVKSTERMAESFPLEPSAAEQPASLRIRGCAKASNPEIAPHAEFPLSASPSSVLHDMTTPRATTIVGGP